MSPPFSQPPKILVVEDDPDTRTTLVALLRREGFNTQGASDGADAINAIESGFRPTVVLADLHMPGIVGHELVEYLKADPALAHIPIAMITAAPESAPDGVPVSKKPASFSPVLTFVRSHTARRAS